MPINLSKGQKVSLTKIKNITAKLKFQILQDNIKNQKVILLLLETRLLNSIFTMTFIMHG